METHGLDTETQVFFYEHDFYVFSSFSAFEVRLYDIDFKTAEHAYHWHKFPHDESVRDMIRAARSAHEAIKLSRKYKDRVRKDWEEEGVKDGVMYMIIKAKCLQHAYVDRKLFQTGDREIIEDSWRDSYWGWGPDKKGKNRLGKLWMRLRDELNGNENISDSTPNREGTESKDGGSSTSVLVGNGEDRADLRQQESVSEHNSSGAASDGVGSSRENSESIRDGRTDQ